MKIVKKVWGHEEEIVNNEHYCGKKLVLKKDHFCSEHFHKIKHETFYIASGEVMMQLKGELITMKPGDKCVVPPLTKHRFRGLEDSEIIEFSTHHEDSDSYRLQPSGKIKK